MKKSRRLRGLLKLEVPKWIAEKVSVWGDHYQSGFRGRYLNAIYQNQSSKTWTGFLLALLIIPVETVLIPQFTIINSLGLVNNRLAVIIPGLASVFNIYLFRNFFIAIPVGILESAKMDGASIVRIFFRIMLPMSKSAVATVGVLSFMSSWNDYI